MTEQNHPREPWPTQQSSAPLYPQQQPPFGRSPHHPAFAPVPPTGSRRPFASAAVAGAASVALLLTGGLVGATLRDHALTTSPSVAAAGQSVQGALTPSDTTPGAGSLGGGLWGGTGGGTTDDGGVQGDGTALQQGVKVDKPGVLLITVAGSGFEGAGTGMILTADGTAVTNYHVVEGSQQVTVVDVATGKTYTADVVGHDQSHDVAVLKIRDAFGLTPVATDAGATVSTGQKVSAVGNGSGQGYLTSLDGTVVKTDVSITARSEAATAERLTGLIETDADVVPGYSGGPLSSSDGTVIGMLAAASQGQSSNQVDGYAIPIRTVLDVVGAVQSGKGSSTVVVGQNAALGVSVSGQQSGRRSGQGGVPLADVQQGGAAAGAGLVAGDTVTAVDGTPVGTPDQLQAAVWAHKPGDSVSVAWTSADGRSHTATVTLGSSPVN